MRSPSRESHTPSSAASATVLVGRFDDLLAHGLRAVVESDPSVRLVCSDVEGRRLSAAIQAHRPKVAIVDCATLASPAEVRELRGRHPQTSLVLLTDHPSGAECAQMLAFGANACLGKSAEARDVLNAIHLVSRGLQLVPRVDAGRSNGVHTRAELLTPREAEVLTLLREGSANAQIAASLHVSIETVRTHARNIYRKLGVSSRRELLAPAAASPDPASRRGLPAAPIQRPAASGDRYRSSRGARRPSHG